MKQWFCPHVGGLGPPFPFCSICDEASLSNPADPIIKEPETEAKKRFLTAISMAMLECYRNSADHGFWEEGVERNKGEMIALLHSELSEMLEGVRKPGPDQHCPEFSSEEIEAADVFIRLLDYCGGHGLRLGEATIAKMAYNYSREHKHGKAF